MPEPTKIPRPFADSGDKNSIPDSSGGLGFASWQEGFPAITGTPFAQGGVAPKRADFNGVFNALSAATVWAQQGGVYAYDSNTDYEAGNVVLDAGGLYVANAGNGPSSAVVQPSSDTTGATWKLVRLDLATQIAAGYMSAADKTKVDSVILTDATPTAAGYMSAADKTRLDSVILTDATPTAAGYMSAADKTKLDGLISTDATPSAAGYMSAADKTKLDGLISTDATQSAAGYMSAADKTRLDSVILTNATQTAAGYMSAADKTMLTALLTNSDIERAATDTSHMTGTVDYKRFGRLLVVSIAGKLNADLSAYSAARLAFELPKREGTPGGYFPTGMVFFDSPIYYGAWLSYTNDGAIYIYVRGVQVPANLQFYGYMFCPITV